MRMGGADKAFVDLGGLPLIARAVARLAPQVDALAIACGTSHGAYKFKGEQHLDLERLKLIKKALSDAGLGDYPLVLHGASSVPAVMLSCVANSVTSIPRATRASVSRLVTSSHGP